MKSGYIAELDARANEIDSLRSTLEGHYVQVEKSQDFEKDDAKKQEIQGWVDRVEQILPAFQTTCRSVKLAIEPWWRC